MFVAVSQGDDTFAQTAVAASQRRSPAPFVEESGAEGRLVSFLLDV